MQHQAFSMSPIAGWWDVHDISPPSEWSKVQSLLSGRGYIARGLFPDN